LTKTIQVAYQSKLSHFTKNLMNLGSGKRLRFSSCAPLFLHDEKDCNGGELKCHTHLFWKYPHIKRGVRAPFVSSCRKPKWGYGRSEVPLPNCIHNQRKKKKMGEHKLPHCCTMRNIMMVGSFVPTLVFLIKKQGGGGLKLPLLFLFFKCVFASRRGGHMHCHYGVLHYVPPLLHNEEHCKWHEASLLCPFFLETSTQKKGELKQWWGAKLFCLQTPTTKKGGEGGLKLPLFFLFFYGCLFQEEAPTSFAITMLFIE